MKEITKNYEWIKVCIVSYRDAKGPYKIEIQLRFYKILKGDDKIISV